MLATPVARTASRAQRRWRALVCALALGGCAPTPDVIATDANPAVTQVPRGRVAVVSGKLVSDIGTPLRGLLLPVDTGFQLADFELLLHVARESGLNAVHVYLENASQATGAALDKADALVALSAQAGLYLVLGLGGGIENGQFDLAKVRSFWTLYAARYRNSTHVLFEVQNNPEVLCDKALNAATLSMEREAYALIRSLAPETHVVLLSLSATPTAALLADSITQLSNAVDWSNASIAFHSEPTCVPPAALEAALAPAVTAEVPVLVNQLAHDAWTDGLVAAERAQIGWFQYRWFGLETQLSSFKQQVVQLGLTWCPDAGSFPEQASQCRPR